MTIGEATRSRRRVLLVSDDDQFSAELKPRLPGMEVLSLTESSVWVADRAGLSRNDAMRAVETMLEVITSTLKRGDEVRLVGFGNFSVTRRKASTGRNPRTGEPMQIKAVSQPKFRPGKVLKDAVQ